MENLSKHIAYIICTGIHRFSNFLIFRLNNSNMATFLMSSGISDHILGAMKESDSVPVMNSRDVFS